MQNQLEYPYKFGTTEDNKIVVVKSGWQEKLDLKEELELYPNAGDGDLVLNFEAIQTLYNLDRQTQKGLQVYPIVLSERDIANTTTILAPFPNYKFLLLNRENTIDCLNLSIAYYACLVNLFHTKPCDIDWKRYVLGNPEKHVDFWLLVKKIPSKQESKYFNNLLNEKRNSLDFTSVQDTNFYFVDAVAAIGSVFDILSGEGLKQMIAISDEKDLVVYPNLALKWVAKHPGCPVKKYISKSLPIWQKHYQKQVLAEPPLSETMQKLVNRRIIKSA